MYNKEDYEKLSAEYEIVKNKEEELLKQLREMSKERKTMRISDAIEKYKHKWVKLNTDNKLFKSLRYFYVHDIIDIRRCTTNDIVLSSDTPEWDVFVATGQFIDVDGVFGDKASTSTNQSINPNEDEIVDASEVYKAVENRYTNVKTFFEEVLEGIFETKEAK